MKTDPAPTPDPYGNYLESSPVASPEMQLELVRQVKAAAADIEDRLILRPEVQKWLVEAVQLNLKEDGASSGGPFARSDSPTKWGELLPATLVKLDKKLSRIQPLYLKLFYWGEELGKTLSHSSLPEDAALGTELLNRVRLGTQAFDQLVESHFRWVDGIVRGHCRPGRDHSDLTQAAQVALMDALQRFDPARGNSTTAYCKDWIVAAIRSELKMERHPVSLPRSTTTRQKDVSDAVEKLGQLHSRPPTEAEIATYLKVDQEQVGDALSAGECVRLDDPEADWGGLAALAFEDEPGCNLDLETRRKMVETVLWSLSPRDRDILVLRFGLFDGVKYELTTIGEHYKITRGRNEQIEARAMRAMINKAPLKSRAAPPSSGGDQGET